MGQPSLGDRMARGSDGAQLVWGVSVCRSGYGNAPKWDF